MEIKARNVHRMLPMALSEILKHGRGEESRNGPVLRIHEPVTLTYERPEERVLFWPQRNANPFFHFMECLWMIAGRNDVQLPATYAKSIAQFSDDGETFHGAYGYRWRKHFGKDQLLEACRLLSRNKNDRRVVIQMWDAGADLGHDGKDVPCNLIALPSMSDGRLNLTVYNRSNDLVWGALGANAVHFSFLLEWIARAIGVPVGRYFQVTNNLHLYALRHAGLAETLGAEPDFPSPYEVEQMDPFPIMRVPPAQWMEELGLLLEQGTTVMGVKEPFFRRVAVPLMEGWNAYKAGDLPIAMRTVSEIQDPAWKKACWEWIDRARYRKARYTRADDDGVNYED